MLSKSVTGGLRAARTAPARSSLAILPSESEEALIADSNRATGVPRSMIRTDSPARTWSISALSPFFASVIVARTIWLD